MHQVIDAANSQPYSHIHRPGIAVGGHCIPVYPRLYLSNDPDATVVRTAREANERMPAEVVRRLAELHGGLLGQRVVILGASYRGGVKETAFSGVFPTQRALVGAGAEVRVHDPMYTDDELAALGLSPHHLGEPADAAVIQADHVGYASLGPADLPGVRTLVDGRGITDPQRWDDLAYAVVGRGTIRR